MKGRLVALVILSFLLVLSLISVTGVFNSVFVKTTGEVIAPGTSCGNGIIEGTEQCDRYNLHSQNCATQLGTGSTGTLKCSASCAFDKSLCVACKTETNDAFCFRMDKTCGPVTGTDNCGQPKKISCGVCGTGSSCVNNNCVVSIACTQNCSSLKYQCGVRTICGQNVNCGSCSSGYVCQTNGSCLKNTTRTCTSASQCDDGNVCTTDTCLSYICSHVAISGCGSCVVTTYIPSLSTFCGSESVIDNCGNEVSKTGTLTCPNGQTCTNNVCKSSTCTPATCASLGRSCGSWSDNCGSNLNCGTCTTGQICTNGVCAGSNQIYCCEKLKTNLWCQETIQAADCATGVNPLSKLTSPQNVYRSAPTLCEFTSYCKLGTCINPNTGACNANIPETTCTSSGGAWSTKPIIQIPECQQICCILGQNTFFVNPTECKNLFIKYNTQGIIRSDITSAGDCEATKTCGDGSCNTGETCSTCPGDCGSCCGNAKCDNSETCSTCPGDCGCSTGYSCKSGTCVKQSIWKVVWKTLV